MLRWAKNKMRKGEIACYKQFLLFSQCFPQLHILTHYQTTNFRFFQTDRVCRRQFQIQQKWQKVIQTGRKHCGKRRNCSLQAKRLVSQGDQKVSLCGNGLSASKCVMCSSGLKLAKRFGPCQPAPAVYWKQAPAVQSDMGQYISQIP